MPRWKSLTAKGETGDLWRASSLWHGRENTGSCNRKPDYIWRLGRRRSVARTSLRKEHFGRGRSYLEDKTLALSLGRENLEYPGKQKGWHGWWAEGSRASWD